MIVDKLKNSGIYYGLSERIATGLKYLQEKDLAVLEPGKYEIDGSNIFLLIQDYTSKPLEEGKLEAHRCYIDIQYIIEGAEKIGYDNIEKLENTTEYSNEKDIVFFNGLGDLVTVKKGYFAIFFPEDAHAPCIAVNNPERVKKAVVKVLV